MAFQSSCTLTKMNGWTEKCIQSCIKARSEILNSVPATLLGSLQGGFAIVNLSFYNKEKQNSCFHVVQEQVNQSTLQLWDKNTLFKRPSPSYCKTNRNYNKTCIVHSMGWLRVLKQTNKIPQSIIRGQKFTFLIKHSFCLCNENTSIYVYKSKMKFHSKAFKTNILCLKFTETGVSQPIHGLQQVLQPAILTRLPLSCNSKFGKRKKKSGPSYAVVQGQSSKWQEVLATLFLFNFWPKFLGEHRPFHMQCKNSYCN